MSRRPLRLSLACVAFSLLSISAAAQAPPSADSYVTKISPSTNYGSAPILAVQEGTTAYVQFDLSAVPPDVTTERVTVRLYVNGVLAPGKFDVYQVDETWSENTLNYNNAPLLGESATGGKAVVLSEGSLNHFVMVDITQLALGWLNGTTPNNGIALVSVPDADAREGSFSFDSKENASTGHEPELQILCSFPSSSSLQVPPNAKFCQDKPGSGKNCCLCISGDCDDIASDFKCGLWCSQHGSLKKEFSKDHICK